MVDMSELKIKIPSELEHKMMKFSKIDWSDVARESIREHVYRLTRLKSIVSKSKFTEHDALEIGKRVNEGMARRYMESLKTRR